MKPPRCIVMKALRLATGDTQWQFAERMGWSLSSVLRYETIRTIQGAALLTAECFAHCQDYNDMAAVLRDCIRKDMGIESALFERMVSDAKQKEAGRQ